MRLHTISAIRALAEDRAREHFDAVRNRLRDEFGVVAWLELPSNAMRTGWIEAHLDLLTDLSRPDSRDAIARLVAEKMGLVCGATAPEFRQTTGSLGGWVLNAGGGTRNVHEFVTRAPHPARGNLPTRGVTLVPALLGVTDPAEALRLIALAVLA